MPGATCRLAGRPLESACGAAVLVALSGAPASFWEAAPSPASAPADAALEVFVACGSVADAPEASASLDGTRVSSMISCLPMGRPRCGGELDRIAVTNWLAFGGLGAPHSAVTAIVCANDGVTRPDTGAEPPARPQARWNCRSTRLCRARSDNDDRQCGSAPRRSCRSPGSTGRRP